MRQEKERPRIRGKFIRAGGVNTHYLEAGEGSPLVLIHGAATTAEEAWANNILCLACHYHVYAPDLVGHGRSTRPKTDYTLQYFSDFFEDFIKTLNLKRASLIGHSMGGGVAINFTINYPDIVQKLILIDSAGFGADTTLLGRLLLSLFILRARFKKDEMYLSIVQNRNKGLKILREKLIQIKSPTLIIWAKYDGYLPVSQAYEAHNLISNSTLHIFKRCWHAPHKEYPDEFNRLVLDFLTSG